MDARLGTRTNALNAPMDTHSIRTESAVKSVIYAVNSTRLKESVRLVIKDTEL
jgi:hypothetical protein